MPAPYFAVRSKSAPRQTSAAQSPLLRSRSGTSPAAESAAVTRSSSVAKQPRADQGSRPALDPRRDRLQQRRGQVRDQRRGGGRRAPAEVEPLELELDPVGARVRCRRLDRRRLAVAADHRRPAELRRRDREHAGAGAEVDERAVRLARVGELEQQLQAHAGGRVGAGPERLARVHADVHRAGGAGRVLPGGPDDEPAAGDRDRLVEVAPAVGPVVGDLGRADLDQALAGGGLEAGELGQLARRAVDRVLDIPGGSPAAPSVAPGSATNPTSSTPPGTSSSRSASTRSASSGRHRTASRITSAARRESCAVWRRSALTRRGTRAAGWRARAGCARACAG